MDERRLAELFQDAADAAARQAPPATFDHADVLAGSRRAGQLRRRRAAGAASAVAVVAAAAVGLAVAGVFGPSAGTSSTLAGPAPASARERPAAPEHPFALEQPSAPDRAAAPQARSARPAEPMPYGAPPPGSPPEPKAPAPYQATPFGTESRDARPACASPDPELFAQLAAVLPAVHGAAPRPLADPAACPPGGRGVEVDVDDGGARGVLRVVYSPPGSDRAGAEGTVATASRSTRDGGRIGVTVIPAVPGRVPFADRLDRVSADLAGRW